MSTHHELLPRRVQSQVAVLLATVGQKFGSKWLALEFGNLLSGLLKKALKKAWEPRKKALKKDRSPFKEAFKKDRKNAFKKERGFLKRP